MINTQTINGFIKKELSQLLRDKKMRIILFVLPVIQMIIFATAISTEVKNVKIGFSYSINNASFLGLTKHFKTGEWFKIAPINKNSNHLEMMKKGKLDAVIFEPINKTNNYQVLIDGTNLIKAQAVESYIDRIFSTNYLGDKKPPINFKIRTLYNPEMNSSYFLIPGTMAMIIGLLTILLTSLSIAREKEMGTLEMIFVSPITTVELIMGKTLPFLFFGIINSIVIVVVAVVFFNVPMIGNYFTLFFAIIIFVFSTVSIGTFISTFSRNQQQAMLAGFIFLFIANLIAGIMFPIDNMPTLLKFIANLNPLKHFVDILREVMLKGGGFEQVLYSIMGMGIVGVLILIFSYRRLNKHF